MTAVHPRAHGEEFGFGFSTNGWNGSPPCTRGGVPGRRFASNVARFTPVHTGKRIVAAPSWRRWSGSPPCIRGGDSRDSKSLREGPVHPRAHGEGICRPCCHPPRTVHPRAYGEEGWSCAGHQMNVRFTPAYTGKSKGFLYSIAALSGSSPCTRGGVVVEPREVMQRNLAGHGVLPELSDHRERQEPHTKSLASADAVDDGLT